MRNHLPELVIVDLELNYGVGSGHDFLEELQKTKLSFRPLIHVTTNVESCVFLNLARSYGVDYIFSKHQEGYSIKRVIDMALKAREFLYRRNRKIINSDADYKIESPEDRKILIMEKIEREMDLIGVPNNLQGRQYLIDGIYFLLTYDPGKNPIKETVMDYLARINVRHHTTITGTINTAIRNTWKRSPIEDLEQYYTDRIDFNTGIPTPADFLTFYVKKIRKEI